MVLLSQRPCLLVGELLLLRLQSGWTAGIGCVYKNTDEPLEFFYWKYSGVHGGQQTNLQAVSSNFLAEKLSYVRDASWSYNLVSERGISTAGSERSSGKAFADFSIFKGKAALLMSPVPPTFTKMDVTTEVGCLISLGPDESCEFFHDPSMKSSLEGQVKKTLTISPLNDGGGYMFNLSTVAPGGAGQQQTVAGISGQQLWQQGQQFCLVNNLGQPLGGLGKVLDSSRRVLAAKFLVVKFLASKLRVQETPNRVKNRRNWEKIILAKLLGRRRSAFAVLRHAAVMNAVQKTNERFTLPVTKAEFSVMRTACGFVLPLIMGWDRVIGPHLDRTGHGPPEQSAIKMDPALEWER
ncbi:Single-stranded DNA-binding protein WHY2, mitochondrial [Dendrobium catenatum]|uniref:Single-stranded DNA-binding protein WHY2, mitochondrial n=1 Tax=Dendrobium catenatum TaxID=906689 RepID=A0A2I0WM04_9ASPA|nr:Single-stranded DNA-binding protein WHY2, mitochondrial [Dendrobium catenatum]